MHRNVRAEFRTPASIQPPNSTWLTANTTSKTRAPSKVLGQLQDNRALAVHKRNKGATTRSPAASPNHQVNPMAAPSVHCANPPRHRLATPTAALTMVLSAPARAANRNTVLARSKALRPPANRSTNHAPNRPSSVFPVAMPNDVTNGPALVRFATRFDTIRPIAESVPGAAADPSRPSVEILTRNAPRKMAGQTRYPNTRSPARAIPEGAQTAVALA